MGHHVRELPFLSEGMWNDVVSSLAAGVSVRRESEDAMLGDEPRFIGYAVSPLNTLEGKPSGYTLIFQDLTEMKKLEADLRLKDRMAAVGELSAGIAHEIRNPLAAIAGSGQGLKKSTAPSPP